MYVGIAGFEPTTSSSRTKRATKLRYIPLIAAPPAYLADGKFSGSARYIHHVRYPWVPASHPCPWIVGMTGIEPAWTCSQGRRATITPHSGAVDRVRTCDLRVGSATLRHIEPLQHCHCAGILLAHYRDCRRGRDAVARTGFEPVPRTLKGWDPRPLDERAMSGSELYLGFLLILAAGEYPRPDSNRRFSP